MKTKVTKFNTKVARVDNTIKTISLLPEKEKKMAKLLLSKSLHKYLGETLGKDAKLIAMLNSKVKVAPADISDLTSREYFDKHLLKEAKKLKVPAKKISEIQKELDKTSKTTIGEILELDTPLKEHPIIGKEVRKNIVKFEKEIFTIDVHVNRIEYIKQQKNMKIQM